MLKRRSDWVEGQVELLANPREIFIQLRCRIRQNLAGTLFDSLHSTYTQRVIFGPQYGS